MAELQFGCFEYYHACQITTHEKFLMNSNMTLTVLNLHQNTDPKVQQDFKGQGYWDKVKGQIKVTP